MQKKPNLKQWEINYQNHNILISNWWGWNLEGSSDLYVDDQHLDQNTSMVPDTSKPFLKTYDFSNNIDSIEVFIGGFFSVKISVLVNGENIYQDQLNIIDRLFIKKWISLSVQTLSKHEMFVNLVYITFMCECCKCCNCDCCK